MHRPVSEGTINWKSAVRALKEIGYDEELSLELYYGGVIEFEKDPVGYLKKVYRPLTELI